MNEDLEKIQDIARRVLDAAERAGEDPLQFYRYIVKDEERIYEKLDVKSLKDFTAALKGLKELAEEGQKEAPGLQVNLGEAESFAL